MRFAVMLYILKRNWATKRKQTEEDHELHKSEIKEMDRKKHMKTAQVDRLWKAEERNSQSKLWKTLK